MTLGRQSQFNGTERPLVASKVVRHAPWRCAQTGTIRNGQTAAAGRRFCSLGRRCLAAGLTALPRMGAAPDASPADRRMRVSGGTCRGTTDQTGGVRTRCSLVVALLISVIFVALGPAPAASAHATLLFTTPAVDGAVPTSPQTLQLVFDETVAPSASSLSLEASSGRAYSLGTVTSGDKGQTISAPVPSRLPVGQYLVRWQVGAEDGDTMRGEYRFAVGSTSGLTPGTAAVGTRGLAATSLLRWALFAGLSLALGGLVGSWLVSRSSGRTERLPAPLPWARAGANMGAVACAGLALLILGGGSLWRGLSLVSPEALMSSFPGRLAGLELVAFVVAAALLWGGRRVLAVMFLLVVPVAEGLRAHPQGSVPGLGAMLTGVHLAAAAVWVGALVHVIRVGRARRRVGAPAAGLVRSYARLALWLFLVVVLSGTISALILIPRGELTATLATTTYGRWLASRWCSWRWWRDWRFWRDGLSSVRSVGPSPRWPLTTRLACCSSSSASPGS